MKSIKQKDNTDNDEVAELKKSIKHLKRVLKVIAENPEWQDHHCRAKAALSKAI